MKLYCSKDSYFVRPLDVHCALRPRLLSKISLLKFFKSIVPDNSKSHEGLKCIF